MATKSSTKTAKSASKHDLLYIMSPTCGWCKKSDPVVEELIKEGHKITTLDLTNPEQAKIANEAKSKHNAQCGTPLFLDAETGNMKCGFAEKDIVEKWAKGEEIPAPPQPKSPPPPPPTDFNDTAAVDKFKTDYETWAKENDHLPRILPVDQVLQRMQMAQQQRNQQGAPNPQGPQAGPPTQVNTGGAPTGGMNTGTGNIIVDNRLQILESKSNIMEAKLDQILDSFKALGNNPQAPARNVQGPQAVPTAPTPSKSKIESVRAEAAKKRAQLEQKSKANKKTVKGL